MPKRFKLVELDGTTRMEVEKENADVQVNMTRNALTLLADLVEFGGPGGAGDSSGLTTLSDFVDSGRAYDVEKEAELRKLVKGKMAVLETWTRTAGSQTRAQAWPRAAALQTLAALRAAGFGGEDEKNGVEAGGAAVGGV